MYLKMFLRVHIRRKSTVSSVFISPKEVLSNKENCIKNLRRVKIYGKDGIKNRQEAAVLVPLCEVDNQMCFLYTVRARHLRVNGGHVAFPGGRFDQSDGSHQLTALRETQEEIGLSPHEVEIWERGPLVIRTDVRVIPFLGYIKSFDPSKLALNHDEVSEVFTVPLGHLCSPENIGFTQFRVKKSLIIKTPVYMGTVKQIWGMTAFITHIMLKSLVPNHYNIEFSSSYKSYIIPDR